MRTSTVRTAAMRPRVRAWCTTVADGEAVRRWKRSLASLSRTCKAQSKDVNAQPLRTNGDLQALAASGNLSKACTESSEGVVSQL